MDEKKNKTVIVLAGPTAVGKTAAAIQLAKHYNTEIISADSRQCYRELKIGVARPSAAELLAVNHYFIASHSIHQKVTAADFEQYALEKAEQIFRNNDVVVMTGGTGLYIKAFCEGMDPIPAVPEEIRSEVNDSYKKNGLEWLQAEIQRLDPAFFSTGEVLNPHRMLRALEVIRSTGKSILEFRTGKKTTRNFNIKKIAINLPKEALHRNINARVDQMMADGLLDEVRSLIPYRHLNALNTVGYKELFDHLNGGLKLQEAVEQIKKNTRQYAKRQLTWIMRDKGYKWMDANEFNMKKF